MLFSRSASIFTAVYITIMSYFMIAFPVSANLWFTSRKTKGLALLVLFLSICLAIPRYSLVYIGANPFYKNEYFGICKLQKFPYLLKPTKLHKPLNGVHNQIDYMAPLPLLVLFKFLSYLNVRRLNKKRKEELNCHQKKQIQAVRMFLPVVVVLCICNFGPIIYYFFFIYKGIVYREMYALVCLSTALNSSVNFPIYYFRASNFRNEAKVLLSQIFAKIRPGGKEVSRL